MTNLDTNKTQEDYIHLQFEVTRLVDGLDFGEGTISMRDRIHANDDPLEHEDVIKLEAAIQRPELLVSISLDSEGKPIRDDGCGDGRGVARIFKRGIEVLKKSLNRAKVFGGGLTMAVSARIGLGIAKEESLQDNFSASKKDLLEKKIDFGAHTDGCAHGESCGCGAIDQAPQIVVNANKYKQQIAGVVHVLTAGNHEEQYLEEVQQNFADSEASLLSAPYSGRKVIGEVHDEDKVVKELEGDHKETHIIINTIPGTTVDQDYVRAQTDGKAQAFAVDEWRLRQISIELYDTVEDQEKAYLSMLVYTLATAATLTKGDLPVYVITASNEQADNQPMAA